MTLCLLSMSASFNKWKRRKTPKKEKKEKDDDQWTLILILKDDDLHWIQKATTIRGEVRWKRSAYKVVNVGMVERNVGKGPERWFNLSCLHRTNPPPSPIITCTPESIFASDFAHQKTSTLCRVFSFFFGGVSPKTWKALWSSCQFCTDHKIVQSTRILSTLENEVVQAFLPKFNTI